MTVRFINCFGKNLIHTWFNAQNHIPMLDQRLRLGNERFVVVALEQDLDKKDEIDCYVSGVKE